MHEGRADEDRNGREGHPARQDAGDQHQATNDFDADGRIGGNGRKAELAEEADGAGQGEDEDLQQAWASSITPSETRSRVAA